LSEFKRDRLLRIAAPDPRVATDAGRILRIAQGEDRPLIATPPFLGKVRRNDGRYVDRLVRFGVDEIRAGLARPSLPDDVETPPVVDRYGVGRLTDGGAQRFGTPSKAAAPSDDDATVSLGIGKPDEYRSGAVKHETRETSELEPPRHLLDQARGGTIGCKAQEVDLGIPRLKASFPGEEELFARRIGDEIRSLIVVEVGIVTQRRVNKGGDSPPGRPRTSTIVTYPEVELVGTPGGDVDPLVDDVIAIAKGRERRKKHQADLRVVLELADGSPGDPVRGMGVYRLLPSVEVGVDEEDDRAIGGPEEAWCYRRLVGFDALNLLKGVTSVDAAIDGRLVCRSGDGYVQCVAGTNRSGIHEGFAASGVADGTDPSRSGTPRPALTRTQSGDIYISTLLGLPFRRLMKEQHLIAQRQELGKAVFPGGYGTWYLEVECRSSTPAPL
jgi:hypothetical protein